MSVRKTGQLVLVWLLSAILTASSGACLLLTQTGCLLLVVTSGSFANLSPPQMFLRTLGLAPAVAIRAARFLPQYRLKSNLLNHKVVGVPYKAVWCSPGALSGETDVTNSWKVQLPGFWQQAEVCFLCGYQFHHHMLTMCPCETDIKAD